MTAVLSVAPAELAVLDGGAVVWPDELSAPTFLDPVDSIVYQMLDGVVSEGEIIDDVVEVLGIPHPVVASRVQSALEYFRISGLLDWATVGEERDSIFLLGQSH